MPPSDPSRSCPRRPRSSRKPLELLLLLLILLPLASCAQDLTDTGVPGSGEDDGHDRAPLSVQGVTNELTLLPENTRYFQYRGLPLVLFGHQAGLSPVPVATFSAEKIEEAANYGNSLFTAIHPAWVNATFRELLNGLQDESHWQHLEDLARTAYEQGVVLHLYFWSYKWNYGDGAYTRTDMLWADPNEEGGEAVSGWSRRDLHELAIQRVVEATWKYPNVVYDFMWEYNTRRDLDPEGDFHRWWVEELRTAGRRIDPDVSHLVSITDGRALPGDDPAQFGSAGHADFVVEEDGNGFWYSCETGREKLLDYRVPLVFTSSDYPFADNDFGGWENVPYCERERSNGGSVADYRVRPDDIRNILLGGFHPAEAWAPAGSDTLAYYLQARWYMENVGVLDASLDAELDRVPNYQPASRPLLSNPEGYVHGRAGESYGAIYAHPEGLPPAQAEVWIDVDGDGRFSPDPDAGERFRMEAQGNDYRTGVLFTVEAPADRNYLFRFAGQHWNPPLPGGLVPGEAGGISYRHWDGVSD